MKLDEIFINLKANDFRLTKARKELIELFYYNAETHYTIENILAILTTSHAVNVATTYNNLAFLLESKIIVESILDGQKYYELFSPFHGHFICLKCGQITNIDFPGMACFGIEINRKYGANITENIIEFKGICEECSKGKNG